MPGDSTNKDLFTHFSSAVFPIILAHPLRVALNIAVYNQGIRPVFLELKTCWHSNLGLNLFRGTSAVFFQSLSKQSAQTLLGQDTTKGKVAGWFAASLTGTMIAGGIETIFIRRTVHALFKNIPVQTPLSLFNLPLLTYYFSRESGFAYYILCKDDIPPALRIPAFAAVSALTATCHKLATWEATADIMQAAKEGTIPSAKRDGGIVRTFSAIAHGNVYTHPTCRTPHQPTLGKSLATWQLFHNFFAVSCGYNMLLIRTAHLIFFGAVRSLAIEATPKVKNYFSLWAEEKRLSALQQPANTETFIHKKTPGIK